MQLFLMQIAIASGESFVASRARICAEVAAEVGNGGIVTFCLTASFNRLVSGSALYADG